MATSTEPSRLRTYSAGMGEASIGELTAQLSEQISRLVRDELALAQLEAKQKAKRLAIGVGGFGASGVAAAFGAMVALAAAVLGLANVVRPWLAAVIVAGALFLGAGCLLLVGLLALRRAAPPVPTEAIESAREDVAVVRQAIRR